MNNPNIPPVPPVQPMPPFPPQAPVAPMVSKKEYFKKMASPATQLLMKITFAVGVLCLLLIFLASNDVVNGSFFKIPIVDAVVPADVDEALEELEDILDDIEEAIEDDDDDVIEELEEEYGMDIEKAQKFFKKLIKNPSINNMKKLAEITDDHVGSDVSEIFGAIVFASFFAAFVYAALTACGLIFAKTPLVITSCVLAVGFNFALAGPIFAILSLAAHIALAVLLSKLNGEYRNYKNSFAIPVMPVYQPPMQ